MRIGINPEKGKQIAHQAYHKIIVPIYVPNLEGYFKDGLRITKLCIESLIQTKHSKAILTVVNNNSCLEVREYLNQKFESGGIDELVHHNRNLGKIDAVIPIAKSSHEVLITITDADVLFEPGWMQAVEKVYNVFPEAGMVSPVPLSTHYMMFTSSTILKSIFKGGLKIRKEIIDLAPMQRFSESIGRGDVFFDKSFRKTHALSIDRGGFLAVVGCGHFVATYRSSVFKLTPERASEILHGKIAVNEFIDIPVDKGGFWRLATTINYAYHMGNVVEDWMQVKKMDNKFQTELNFPVTKSHHLRLISVLFYPLRKVLIENFLLSNKLKPLFFRLLGLRAKANEF